MGKPYLDELAKLEETHQWASGISVERLQSFFCGAQQHQLIAVGSGGSATAAHFAALLHREWGGIARVCTPLEILEMGVSLRGAHVLLLSASGRNADILRALETVIQIEPRQVMVLTLQKATPLAHNAEQSGFAQSIAAPIPCGKDGFLATNSLLAFMTILGRSTGDSVSFSWPKNTTLRDLREAMIGLRERDNWAVLHSGWASPAAVDIESKFTEAALGAVQMADYRNFGHGRHHWFAKRERQSALIALSSPDNQHLASKTLELLPNSIPKIHLKTEQLGPAGALDLLIQAMHLVAGAGVARGIDPGRPGVPKFGSRLYHLRVPKPYPNQRKLHKAEVAIQRKIFVPIERLSDEERESWEVSYQNFLMRVQSARFGAVVFDYDGTLCSADERFVGASSHIGNELVRLIQSGVVVGIATGRGQSVRHALGNLLHSDYWSNVLVGYYNGSDIARLSDLNRPYKDAITHPELKRLVDLAQQDKQLQSVAELECRPQQLKVQPHFNVSRKNVEVLVLQLVARARALELRVLESGHSFDIVTPLACKLHLVEACRAIVGEKGKSADILCIGDRGRWPGNDYELLSGPFSLSVDEVSPSMDSCWNLCPSGIRGVKATQWYLSHIQENKGHLRLNLKGR